MIMMGVNNYFLDRKLKTEDFVPICSKHCLILIYFFFLHACFLDLLVFIPSYLKFVPIFQWFRYLSLCCDFVLHSVK